ncbi:MAG TPA: diguanylate cyclase [Planctomycetota bacterium]|nr:diguanylate cyclase [Planctomycetota bacterium]
MAQRRDIRAEKQRLERLVHEATQRVTLLERERKDLQEENEKLRERTRLVERIGDELSVVNEKLELLSRLTKEINSLNPEKIFETAVTRIPYIVNARYASIYILDEDSGKLYLKKHTHDRPIDRVVEIEGEATSLMARVIAGGKVRVFADLESAKIERVPGSGEGAGDAESPEKPAAELNLTGDESGPIELPNRGLYATKSCIVAPLRAGGRTQGVLNLADRVDGRPFSVDADGPLVKQVADLLAISLRNWKLFEKLQRQAKTDSLTKLSNHQAFFEDLNREVIRADRYGASLAVIMLDIDHFKLVNDNHGHLAGDFVLEEVAAALRATVRLVDTAARYGGDEFAVLLPESDLKGAIAAGERLRARIRQQRFTYLGKELPVSMSLGVAMHRRGEAASELVRAADEQMYRAKREGGDRICVRD